MSCPCEFEPAIQFDCGMQIVRIIRSGELGVKRAEVLQHVGCIIGSLGAKLNEGDDGGLFADGVALPKTLDDCCDELEARTANAEASSIDPAVWAILLQLARLLIEKYL